MLNDTMSMILVVIIGLLLTVSLAYLVTRKKENRKSSEKKPRSNTYSLPSSALQYSSSKQLASPTKSYSTQQSVNAHSSIQQTDTSLNLVDIAIISHIINSSNETTASSDYSSSYSDSSSDCSSSSSDCSSCD